MMAQCLKAWSEIGGEAFTVARYNKEVLSQVQCLLPDLSTNDFMERCGSKFIGCKSHRQNVVGRREVIRATVAIDERYVSVVHVGIANEHPKCPKPGCSHCCIRMDVSSYADSFCRRR